MATNAAVRTISGLARAMVQHGLLSEYAADAMQSQAQTANIGFVEPMVLSKRMSSAQIAMFASRAVGTPMVDLGGFDTEHFNMDLVGARIGVTRRVLAR